MRHYSFIIRVHSFLEALQFSLNKVYLEKHSGFNCCPGQSELHWEGAYVPQSHSSKSSEIISHCHFPTFILLDSCCAINAADVISSLETS